MFLRLLQTLLRSPNLGEVLRSVRSLEMFTLISSYVCERMVAEGALPVILTALSSCNRSKPQQMVVGHCLRVLFNIGEHPPLLAAISREARVVPVLTDLVQGYRQARLWVTWFR